MWLICTALTSLAGAIRPTLRRWARACSTSSCVSNWCCWLATVEDRHAPAATPWDSNWRSSDLAAQSCYACHQRSLATNTAVKSSGAEATMTMPPAWANADATLCTQTVCQYPAPAMLPGACIATLPVATACNKLSRPPATRQASKQSAATLAGVHCRPAWSQGSPAQGVA